MDDFLNQFSSEKSLDIIRTLITFECAMVRNNTGYVDGREALIHLTNAEALTALRYGIPIGVKSIFEDYHGIHKGDCDYELITSMDEIRKGPLSSGYERRPSLSPFLHDPVKMRDYITQVMELEKTVGISHELLGRSTALEEARNLRYKDILESRGDGDVAKLKARIDNSIEDYRHSLDKLSSKERLNKSDYTRAMLDAHTYLTAYLSEHYSHNPDEVSYLLSFQNPLGLVTREWLNAGESVVGANVLSELVADRKGDWDIAFPSIFESTFPSTLSEKLMQGLRDNVVLYRDQFLESDMDTSNIAVFTRKALVCREAYDFLTKEYIFRDGEIENLLQLENPLETVTSQWPDGIYDSIDINNAVRKTLAEDMSTENTITGLHKTLDENLEDNLIRLQSEISAHGLTMERLIKLSQEVSDYVAAHECLKEHEFKAHECEYLLESDDPLAIFADSWPRIADGLIPMDGVIEDILDAIGINDEVQSPAKIKEVLSGTSEKPSVLAQLQQKEQEVKRQTPGKEKTSKSELEK